MSQTKTIFLKYNYHADNKQHQWRSADKAEGIEFFLEEEFFTKEESITQVRGFGRVHNKANPDEEKIVFKFID